jgi:hypothetical protein
LQHLLRLGLNLTDGSVLIEAGSMRTTRTAHGRSSRRSASVIEASAHFEDVNGAPYGRVSRSPIEPMVMMRPAARRSSGRNAWITVTCPKTLTS